MPRPLTSSCAKEYVESLHQNSRATLLYGKNNVLVLPVRTSITILNRQAAHVAASVLLMVL
jgi:small G protein signaling modulator 2